MSIRDKKGEIYLKLFLRICVENTRMFCLGGVEIVFENGRKLIFGVSNLGGELVCIFVVFLFSVFFTHMWLCVLFKCFRKYTVDSIELLSTLATDGY